MGSTHDGPETKVMKSQCQKKKIEPIRQSALSATKVANIQNINQYKRREQCTTKPAHQISLYNGFGCLNLYTVMC